MAIINVRRMRDAFVRTKVTDDANGLELATSLDEELSETVVSKERFETLEGRLDAKFDLLHQGMRAEMKLRFAEAEADAERRANRHTTIFLAALALAVAVIALLMVAL